MIGHATILMPAQLVTQSNCKFVTSSHFSVNIAAKGLRKLCTGLRVWKFECSMNLMVKKTLYIDKVY